MLEVFVLEYEAFNDSISTDRKRLLVEFASSLERGLYEQQYEWKKRREIRIKSAAYTCEKCGCQPDVLDVHHLCYDRYGNENFYDLQVLCKECHKEEHEKYPCLDRKHVVKEIGLNEYFSGITF